MQWANVIPNGLQGDSEAFIFIPLQTWNAASLLGPMNCTRLIKRLQFLLRSCIWWSLYCLTASSGIAPSRPLAVTSIPRHGSPLSPCRMPSPVKSMHPSASISVFVVEERSNVFRIVRLILVVPRITVGTRVEENRVVNRADRSALLWAKVRFQITSFWKLFSPKIWSSITLT